MFQTDKQLLVNQPDMVLVDKEQKTAVKIDRAFPADSNIRKREHEKTVPAPGTTGTDVENDVPSGPSGQRSIDSCDTKSGRASAVLQDGFPPIRAD